MLATQYAQWYNIAAQKNDESDTAFVARVSGELRKQGAVIEAHECAQNRRYEDSDDGDFVLAGITGMIAMKMQGVDYGSTGSDLIGDEIAAGIIATSPKKDTDPVMALLAAMLFSR